jgi:phage shock protein PspC (stress-responsive transcriptional regulator)
MIAGVAAGFADYLDVDVVVVRIAFVVLAALGGTGVWLYLAAWLLMPPDTDDTPRSPGGDHHTMLSGDAARPAVRERRALAVVVGVVLGVVAIGELVSGGPWWPHWGDAPGTFLAPGLAALVLAVVVVAVTDGRSSAWSRMRLVVIGLLVAAASVVLLTAGTVLGAEALSGVPLRGGIGSTQWRPTAPAQVAHRYRLAVGNMTLDLRDVRFSAGTTRVTATVGVGRLLVEVPRATTVSVAAHSGLGDVQVFGQNYGGLDAVHDTQVATRAPGQSRLMLDAATGVGQVVVSH